MEMLVIGLIAIAAFAAVLFPLFRRRPGIGDETEFENIPPANTAEADASSARTGSAGPAPAAPGSEAGSATGGEAGSAAGGEAGSSRGDVPDAPPGAAQPSSHPSPEAVDAAIEAEVVRYREAVRAGTVCRRCGQANPADSAYCFECGARLPLADAKEFE